MVEFERSLIVTVDADTAFEFFADPARLPDHVPAVTLVESTAVDGALDADTAAGAAPDPGSRPAQFSSDSRTRRVEWRLPGGYEGSAEVEPGTVSTARVTIRLRVQDETGAAEIERELDRLVRALRGRLSRI